MAFVEFDQSQRKPVAVLLTILVIAIGVTVFRINSVPAKKLVLSQPTKSQPAHAEVTCVQGGTCELARNPFVRPMPFRVADSASSRVDAADGNREKNAYGKSNTLEELAPIPVPGVLAAAANSNPPATKPADQPPPKPSYVLLATVKDHRGVSAVIAEEHEGVRVVEVGDKVAGDLRVKKIETGRAVLADGRVTIIAKRPRS